MRYFLLFVISLAWLFTKAQADSIDIIEFSSLTKGATKPLPFDQVFYIKIPDSKGKNGLYLDIIKYRNGEAVPFSCYEVKRMKLVYGTGRVNETFNEKKDANQETKIQITLDTSNTVQLKDGTMLVQIFPLNPSTTYGFNFISGGVDLVKSNIDAIFEGKASFKAKDQPKNNAKDSIVSRQIDSLRQAGKYKEAIEILLSYDESLGEKGKKLNKSIENIEAIQTAMNGMQPDISKMVECYETIWRRVEQNCARKDSCAIFCPDDLTLLSTLTANSYNTINQGFRAITSSLTEAPCEQSDYEKRISNLGATIKYLEELFKRSPFIEGDQCASMNTVLNDFVNYLGELRKIFRNWNALLTTISEYTIAGTRPLATFSTSNYSGMSDGGMTEKSQGKFVVRPDFGFGFATNYLVTPGEPSTFSTVLPFTGLRFNFRPLDQSIPFRNIVKKSCMHRLSLNVSLTLSSISDSTTRFNLYNKSNFVLGLGYRLNNVLNLSAGTVFYQRLNPNPFVSNKQLTAMPYFGITIDFDVVQSAKSLIEFFK